jgi:small subunit ribosomal protein S8
MVSTDPIADMLTRIRNAAAVSKNEVALPYSKIKHNVAQVLVANGYLASVEITDGVVAKQLHIVINHAGTSPRITGSKRLSTPGRRMYASCDAIPRVKQGRGLVIISTSKGIMAGAEAKSQRLGGELICEVY